MALTATQLTSDKNDRKPTRHRKPSGPSRLHSEQLGLWRCLKLQRSMAIAGRYRRTHRIVHLCVFARAMVGPSVGRQNSPSSGPASSQPTDFGHFIAALRGNAHGLANSSGMQLAFQSFVNAHSLPPSSVRYSDFLMVRMVYESARDAGFWNMHWEITNQPPNSHSIWRQWATIRKPSPLEPTATAECDELSALFSLLVERAGVKGVGLFWPYPNHTVAYGFLRRRTRA
jgi:hypothetical protein